MIGKIIRFLLLLVFTGVLFVAAAVMGVRNDLKIVEAQEEEAAVEAEEAQSLVQVDSPFERYTGGVLDLQMDYEVQVSGDDVYVTVVSNLPDSFDLSAELSNVTDVKNQLGFEDIAPEALTQEQLNQIHELAYTRREKNFITNGVCTFLFVAPPKGRLDLNVTSPVISLQPASVQELLGVQGVNLQGSYVVYLEEVADKSINYQTSFMYENT